MKQKFMKKALAVVLSTAMVFSASSVSGMQTASAAAKFVGLNTTFKTLKVGQKDYKLKLVNNTQNWKIKKVATSNKQIATVYGKKASYVLLKGKSEGRATIKVSLKTSARKKNNTKVLKCRVKVVAAGTTTPTPTPNPTPTPTPSQTSKVVATQAELTAALADSTLKSITVKTDSTASFTIPAGSHTAVDLTIDAPNADVTNSGVFKSITIAAIKDSAWTENATGNTFKVDALKARIVVGTGASVAGVSITKANADVAIVVNGKLTSVTISAKAKLALSGSATESTAVKIQAAGSEVTAEIPVAIEASADATIDLKAKAEKSTVKVTNTAATVTVKNNTTATIEITKPDNTVQKVSPKGSATIKPSTSGTNGGYVGGGTSGGSWGTGSGSGSGSNNPSVEKKVCTQAELDAALKNTSLKTILIEDRDKDNDIEITIPEADYNVDLIVNAPKKTITNSGSFKSIEIQDISPATWFERSKKANSFRVSAPNPHIVVEKDAVVDAITFIKGLAEAITNVKLEIKGTISNNVTFEVKVEQAEVSVAKGATAKKVEFKEDAAGSNVSMNVAGKVEDGIACDAKVEKFDVVVSDAEAAVGKVSVSQEAEVTITAESDEIAQAVKVEVELSAENAAVTSAVPVDVTSTVDGTSVVLEKGSDGSTITVKEDVKEVGVKVEADAAAVEVKKEGQEEPVVTVDPGKGGSIDIESGTITKEYPTSVKLANTAALDLNGSTSETLTLTVDPTTASTDGMTVEWLSDNEAVATVTKTAGNELEATVTAVAVGEATITAKATVTKDDGTETELTATCEVTVTDSSTSTDPAETLTNISFENVTATEVTTSSAVSPHAIKFSGVTASATAGETQVAFTASASDIVPADGEEGITGTGNEFTVVTYNNDKNTYSVTVTAKDADSKYTIKVTGTLTISSSDNNDFTAEISWGKAEQVTTS